jgi:hypothetical protein
MLVAQNQRLAPLDSPKAVAINPATMPPATPAVTRILKVGVRSTHFLFPENGPTREVETWVPPRVTDLQMLEEVRDRIRNLAIALTPAPSGDLLSRIMVLLAHYRVPEHSKATEYGIALDWADDLAEYPMWAIEDAARQWRRTKKFRPQICEMSELCEDACGNLKTERRRLESVTDASEAESNPARREAIAVVRSLLQPVTALRSTAAEEQVVHGSTCSDVKRPAVGERTLLALDTCRAVQTEPGSPPPHSATAAQSYKLAGL